MSNRTAHGSKLPDKFADAVGCHRTGQKTGSSAKGGSKNGSSSKSRSSMIKNSGRKGKSSVPKSNDPRKKFGSADADALHTSCKTPQVMKLIESDKRENLVIMAGKSRVPEQLRGRESLSRVMRRGLGEEFSDVDDTVVVNLTEIAIENEAPEILDRFNACSCDKCVEVFSQKIAEKVPARFARISRSHRSGSRELSERLLPMRKIVVSEMIRELICDKRRCFHDE